MITESSGILLVMQAPIVAFVAHVCCKLWCCQEFKLRRERKLGRVATIRPQAATPRADRNKTTKKTKHARYTGTGQGKETVVQEAGLERGRARDIESTEFLLVGIRELSQRTANSDSRGLISHRERLIRIPYAGLLTVYYRKGKRRYRIHTRTAVEPTTARREVRIKRFCRMITRRRTYDPLMV